MISSSKSSNKIIWFLIGNPVFTASSRIHGVAVHRELLRLGYHSQIAYLPEFIEGEIPFDFSNKNVFESLVHPGDIIILQKIKSAANIKLFRYFKQLELKLVLIDCDLPMADEIGGVVDQIICTSKALRDKYLSRGLKASFIEDCPEVYFNSPQKKKKEKLECFWFGDNTAQKWNEVMWLEEIFKDDRLKNWKLVTISNHPQASVQWKPDFLALLKTADVVALPVESQSEVSRVKSANRLLQSMALSLPVICAPLSAYEDIVTPGKDAMICSTEEEWITSFQKMEDEKVREQMGREAFVTSQKFSIDKLISIWIRELGLNDLFKTDNLKRLDEEVISMNDFFYRPLLTKNLFYWKKMKFSVKNVSWLCYCLVLKLRKRLSI